MRFENDWIHFLFTPYTATHTFLELLLIIFLCVKLMLQKKNTLIQAKCFSKPNQEKLGENKIKPKVQKSKLPK